LEKYGDKNYRNVTQYRQTNLEKYGCEYPMQNSYIRSKTIKNSFKINKYKDTELYYQGSYELDFLQKYYNMGIENCKSIKYLYKNKQCIYFPDFYYENLNLIIEIKSDYTYKLHLEKNLAKEKFTKELGYNYIIIKDKNYTEFEKLIN
jgi:hypothetical protein